MDQSCQPPPGDLVLLRATFPDWTFDAHWTVAGTGPDARYLTAHNERLGVTVTAWSTDDMAAQVAAAHITGRGN